MLTCSSPLRFAIRTDAIIATPRVVTLSARTLPRTRLTLTDRPTMRRVERAPQSRRIERAREELTHRRSLPVQVADCTGELATDRRSAAWHSLASLALILVVVALCAAWTLH